MLDQQLLGNLTDVTDVTIVSRCEHPYAKEAARSFVIVAVGTVGLLPPGALIASCTSEGRVDEADNSTTEPTGYN